MTMPTASGPRTLANRLLIVGFVVGITLPAAIGLSRSADDLAKEGRRLAPWPEFRLSRSVLRAAPSQIETAFNDRLAGRAALVRADAVVKTGWLGVSSSPQVNLGSDGWLFLDQAGWRQVNLPGHPEALPCQQAGMWVHVLRQRRDWLAARGIRYLIVIVPEKDGVVEQHLPVVHRRRTPSPCDLVIPELAGDGKTDIVDLRPCLRDAQARGVDVYYHTDTHWNQIGAWVGSRTVLDAIRRQGFTTVTPGPGTDATWTATPPGVRDLTRLLGLDGPAEAGVHVSLAQSRIGHVVPGEVRLKKEIYGPPSIPPQMWESGDASQPRAVMFHDSFGESMRPFLAGQFSRIAFAPTTWLDPGTIEQVRPAVVIQEFVDRTINHVGAANLEEMR